MRSNLTAKSNQVAAKVDGGDLGLEDDDAKSNEHPVLPKNNQTVRPPANPSGTMLPQYLAPCALHASYHTQLRCKETLCLQGAPGFSVVKPPRLGKARQILCLLQLLLFQPQGCMIAPDTRQCFGGCTALGAAEEDSTLMTPATFMVRAEVRPMSRKTDMLRAKAAPAFVKKMKGLKSTFTSLRTLSISSCTTQRRQSACCEHQATASSVGCTLRMPAAPHRVKPSSQRCRQADCAGACNAKVRVLLSLNE